MCPNPKGDRRRKIFIFSARPQLLRNANYATLDVQETEDGDRKQVPLHGYTFSSAPNRNNVAFEVRLPTLGTTSKSISDVSHINTYELSSRMTTSYGSISSKSATTLDRGVWARLNAHSMRTTVAVRGGEGDLELVATLQMED